MNEKNAIKILNDMGAECAREILKAKSENAKKAWYYTHMGELEYAQQLGIVSDQERQKMVRDFKKSVGWD